LGQLENTFSDRTNRLKALVYSHFPFSIKKELIINLGNKSGITEGDAVLLPLSFNGSNSTEIILIGSVASTSDAFSVVRTLYDYRWQSAVRIGKEGVPGLLQGGLSPKVVLISKEAKIKKGDVIYSSNFPQEIGLPIAQIKTFAMSDDKIFQEAEISIPYDLNRINAVLVNLSSSPKDDAKN